MKFFATVVALYAASAYGIGLDFGGNQVAIKEDYKVPGDNPLYFCEDPKDYILDITKVDLDPNPPLP